MKKMRKIIMYLLAAAMILGVAPPTMAKTVVEQRLDQVKKDFPNGSRFNDYVSVDGFNGGGCNALVMYTTLKVFHNAYVPSGFTFNKAGTTASTKSVSKMKKLFGKAKVGDVIRWRAGYTDAHFAIYLTHNSQGVYLYEANFGPKNKVWYKHFWPWSAMAKWPAGGANKVDVYHSKNYNKVNRHQSAKNYSKGQEFVVDGIRYRVTELKGIVGKVKVVGYEEGMEDAKVPKQLFVNMPDDEGLYTETESMSVSSRKRKNINYQVTYKVIG